MCGSSTIEIWTWRELRATGSRRALEDRVRRGQLRRLRRGVYATDTACASAVEAAEHGGSLGCASAARHLGIWVLDEAGAHVWLRAERHHTGISKECTCIRHWDAGASSQTFGLPSVPRILLQILRCSGQEAFFVALESARRLGLITRDGLRWLRQQTDAAGRDLIDFSRADADSGLESLVRLRLRKYGWFVRSQVRFIGSGVTDLMVDDWLIVETDGKANHDGESHRHRDLIRDATAAAWGHATLRFDYAMVVHDWDLVERAIVGMMALRPGR
jgi:very-short-patch-repair endonuclease